MTRKEAAELLPIIKAFSEGEEIETKVKSGWISTDNMRFVDSPKVYRIKKKQKYRHFANAEECWQEMLKHQPFGWVKTDSGYEPIWHVNEGDDFNATFKYSTFADGTPFGVKTGE